MSPELIPTKKPDDAPGVWTIGGGSDSPQFESLEDAEEWVQNNIAGGTYSIDWIDWCDKCQDYTYQIHENGRWVTGCHVCDAAYLEAREADKKKLAIWQGV